MLDWCSLHATLIYLIAKDADSMTVEENLGYDFFCKLGVSLDSHILVWKVHALNSA